MYQITKNSQKFNQSFHVKKKNIHKSQILLQKLFTSQFTLFT